MGLFRDEGKQTDEQREVGVSTEPGASVADQINNEGGEKTVTGTPDNVEQNAPKQVEVDHDAVNLQAPEEVEREPKQVESAEVIFVPHKDFEARVNDNQFHFRQDVPTRVTRDVANMLLEDRERGYIKE